MSTKNNLNVRKFITKVNEDFSRENQRKRIKEFYIYKGGIGIDQKTIDKEAADLRNLFESLLLKETTNVYDSNYLEISEVKDEQAGQSIFCHSVKTKSQLSKADVVQAMKEDEVTWGEVS